MTGTADKQAMQKKLFFSTKPIELFHRHELLSINWWFGYRGLWIATEEMNWYRRQETRSSLFIADYYPNQNQNISSCLAHIQQPLPLQHCPLPDYLILIYFSRRTLSIVSALTVSVGFGASCLLKFLWTVHENWILKIENITSSIHIGRTYHSKIKKKTNTYNLYKNCKTRLWLFRRLLKCLKEMFFKQAAKHWEDSQMSSSVLCPDCLFRRNHRQNPKDWNLEEWINHSESKDLFVPCEETAWFSLSLGQLNWCWNEKLTSALQEWEEKLPQRKLKSKDILKSRKDDPLLYIEILFRVTMSV